MAEKRGEVDTLGLSSMDVARRRPNRRVKPSHDASRSEGKCCRLSDSDSFADMVGKCFAPFNKCEIDLAKTGKRRLYR